MALSRLTWLVGLFVFIALCGLFSLFKRIQSVQSIKSVALRQNQPLQRVFQATRQQFQRGEPDALAFGDANGASQQQKQQQMKEIQSHLLKLFNACYDAAEIDQKNDHEAIIWAFDGLAQQQVAVAIHHHQATVASSDPAIHEHIALCPPIDVFLSKRGRQQQDNCENAAIYVEFLSSRLLADWVLLSQRTNWSGGGSSSSKYFELCSDTPVVFFDVEDLHDHVLARNASWPTSKRVYWVAPDALEDTTPHQITAEVLWSVDAVLCSSLMCEKRFTEWFLRHGNPRNSRVVYTSQASLDVASLSKETNRGALAKVKDFSQVSLVHAPGEWALRRGTEKVIRCWLMDPHLPLLQMVLPEQTYVNDFMQWQSMLYDISSRVNIKLLTLNAMEMGQLLAQANVVLAPSLKSERFGHYLNHARAAQTLVITTDLAPMNQLVEPLSGVLIDSKNAEQGNAFLENENDDDLFFEWQLLVADRDVCRAVRQVVTDMNAKEREHLAAESRRRYEQDLIFFAQQMQRLVHESIEQRSL